MIKRKHHKGLNRALTLSLIFSILVSDNIAAKTHRSNKTIIIVKRDGWKTKARLLNVKDQSLHVWDLIDEKDLIIKVDEIDKIKIPRESRFGKSSLIGMISGGIIGITGGYIYGHSGVAEAYAARERALAYGFVFGIIGTLIGGIVGGKLGHNRKGITTINFRGKSKAKIRKILKNLKSLVSPLAPKREN